MAPYLDHIETENKSSVHNLALEDATMPIAIVGMSGRFPGDAVDPEKLWTMCSEGKDAWSTIPSTRFNQDAFYHPDPSRNGAVSPQ
jgi:acyl transferase domain-containing protein